MCTQIQHVLRSPPMEVQKHTHDSSGLFGQDKGHENAEMHMKNVCVCVWDLVLGAGLD